MEEKEREREREKEKREKRREVSKGHVLNGNSKCAQEVLFMATAEDIFCQDPKSRPVQMPE